MANKDTAKNWFLRGLKPTQAQFHQLFDWLRFKDETIIVDDVTNLQTILNGKASSAALATAEAVLYPEIATHAANFALAIGGGRELEKTRFKPTGNITIRVGTTPGGNELVDDLTFEANVWHLLTFFDFSDVARSVYFTGITASTQFYFYKR